MLITAPVLAIAVQCPDSCSCLLPAKAKELGYSAYCNGKQEVCGYDAAKNAMYCYEKTVSVAPTAPIKPTITTPDTAQPIQCPSGCICSRVEDARVKGLSYCDGKQTLCGYYLDQSPLYCFSLPAQTPKVSTTTTPSQIAPKPTMSTPISPAKTMTPVSSDIPISTATPQPILTVKPDLTPSAVVESNKPIPDAVPCPSDFSCLDQGTIREKGYKLPDGQPMVCGYSKTQGELYCAQSPDGSEPQAVPEDQGIMGAIWSYIISVFNGGPETTPPVQLEPYRSYCLERYDLESCDGFCVDLSTDQDHCGRCGNACASTEICINGTCIYHYGTGECGGGTYLCHGACVDYLTDNENCGGCGIRCDDGMSCCGGRCVDTENDFQHCGACNRQCPYPEICLDRRCMDVSTDRHHCGVADINCEYNELCCAGRCVDPRSDGDNCGGCGVRCNWPSETCCGGTCVTAAFYSSDDDNCGSCGNQCPYNHRCCGGSCENVKLDDNNCGYCGNECDWASYCSDGYCQPWWWIFVEWY